MSQCCSIQCSNTYTYVMSMKSKLHHIFFQKMMGGGGGGGGGGEYKYGNIA